MYVLQNVLHFLTINVPVVPPIHTGLYTEQYFHLMSKYDKIDLHEAYCCRNIRRCQQCSAMVDIKDMDEHNVNI